MAIDKIDGEEKRNLGKKWIERIKEAMEGERKWRRDARQAVEIYANDFDVGSVDDTFQTYSDFNILFANVETIVPAIINSPPQPDIRRRFGDDDPIAKEVSQLLERAMRVQVDDSALQIELEAVAQDAFLAGRGIVRIRFASDGQDGSIDMEEVREDALEEAGAKPDDDAEGDDDNQDEPQQETLGEVTNERIFFEAVSWVDYCFGSARRWKDRPWEAFRHIMTADDVEDFQNDGMVAAQIDDDETNVESDDKTGSLTVWEVWDKKTRKVYFILASTGVIVSEIGDPLRLSGFFPSATPVQPIEVTGRLMPVTPFAVYRDLAREVSVTTSRINALIDAMRVKGWYAGSSADIEAILELGDNQFAPVEDAEIWASHGGVKGAVEFWPIERFASVLQVLYQARQEAKQAIYEITGISDIVRGASKASETLGAQQIKSQWGSLRIQKAQRALERCARELFVMMAEIIPANFSLETLQEMTAIKLVPTEEDMTPIPQPQIPPDAPQEQAQQMLGEWEQAEQARVDELQKLQDVQGLLMSGLISKYRIDVETDSTVRADLTMRKQEVSEFLNGSANYFQAIGPLVQQGAMAPDLALEIYSSNARMFNLGKTVEDALDRMLESVRQQAEQPQQDQPDPQQQALEMDLQLKQAEVEAKKQIIAMDLQTKTASAEIERQKAAAKMAELELRAMSGKQNAEADIAVSAMDERIRAIDLEIKRLDLEIKNKDLQNRTQGGIN